MSTSVSENMDCSSISLSTRGMMLEEVSWEKSLCMKNCGCISTSVQVNSKLSPSWSDSPVFMFLIFLIFVGSLAKIRSSSEELLCAAWRVGILFILVNPLLDTRRQGRPGAPYSSSCGGL